MDTEEAFRHVLYGTEQPIFLCQTHYQCLYRKIHAHIPCAGCDAKPKSSQGGYTRHSPDALSVTNYLNEHTEFEVTITPTDVLCKSCYDTHLVIIKSIESLDNIPDLSSDMSLWSMIVCEEHTTELTRAVLNTVIHVAKMLQQERALLLPQVVNVFTQNYSSSDNTNLFQVTTPTNLPVHFILELRLQSRRKLAPRFFMPTVDYKCTYCVSIICDSTSSNFLLHARYENIKFVPSYPALPYLVISPFPHFRFPFFISSFLRLERPQ